MRIEKYDLSQTWTKRIQYNCFGLVILSIPPTANVSVEINNQGYDLRMHRVIKSKTLIPRFDLINLREVTDYPTATLHLLIIEAPEEFEEYNHIGNMASNVVDQNLLLAILNKLESCRTVLANLLLEAHTANNNLLEIIQDGYSLAGGEIVDPLIDYEVENPAGLEDISIPEGI